MASPIQKGVERDWPSLAAAIGLELVPAIVLFGAVLAFRNDYDDPVDFNRAGLVSALILLFPQGLGWFSAGRYFVGTCILLSRPALLLIPALFFAINTDAASECRRSYVDPAEVRACQDRAASDRWQGIAFGLIVPAGSAFALGMVELRTLRTTAIEGASAREGRIAGR